MLVHEYFDGKDWETEAGRGKGKKRVMAMAIRMVMRTITKKINRNEPILMSRVMMIMVAMMSLC